MQACLTHPEHGFYANLKSVNEHFTTSPEISPLFGEAITAFLLNFYQSQNLTKVRLIELGPGNGTLALDILSCWQKLTDQPLTYIAVENSPSLIKTQQERLQPFGQYCHWIESVSDLNLHSDPTFVNLIIANEFFDALPIRQFIHLDNQWHERVITVSNDRLVFCSIPLEAHLQITFPRLASFYEICQESLEIMKSVSRLMAKSPSIFLVIDYGYETLTDYKDTLQAIRHQSYCDPLAYPGNCDLTAHVDFGQLKSAALPHVCAAKLMTQREFLLSCGIKQRLERLRKSLDHQKFINLECGFNRLTSSCQMGILFKVQIFTTSRVASR